VGNYLPIHGVMFDRGLVVDGGCRFDQAFQAYEDWDFWLQLARHSDFLHVDKVTAVYRISPNSGFGITASARVQEEGKRQVYAKWRSTVTDDEWFTLMGRVYELQATTERSRITAEELRVTTEEKDRLLGALEASEQEREGINSQVAALKATIQDHVSETLSLRALVDQQCQEIDRHKGTILDYQSSTSWRLTAPLRALRRKLVLPKRLATYWHSARNRAELCGGWLQFALLAVKRYSEGRLTQLRRSASALQTNSGDVEFNSVSSDVPPPIELYRFLQEVGSPDPVTFRPLDGESVEPGDCDVRLIALYLPQYHSIPENNAWWGKGFTEWTNVSKALPQFIGHYQPRLPGELGFYDLRMPDVMRRQVELARQYGIQGFCFHYYWFGGKRLLERPLEMFLSDRSLDLSFCICWANENWTRRWDGKDDDVLMAQNYLPEDDIAFIEALVPVFQDPRYIKVGGKPLLIVYRPALMPNARDTAARWREVCRRRGIGEIFLTMAQCFDDYDPRPYGFDASMEFPPHQVGVGPGAIGLSKDPLKWTNSEFNGFVYDYNSVVERNRSLPYPDYPLFKTVFPGWDNDARKPGAGNIFHASTPTAYRTWLSDCCRTARLHPVSESKDAVVFINAWNEWVEGAYLEPDRHYGYAYLAATRDVVREFSRSKRESLVKTQQFERHAEIAVVVHLYYPDLWEEIYRALKNIPDRYDIYVSLSPYADKSISALILRDRPDAHIFQFENVGRDIYPFVELLKRIAPMGYRYLCKIHSKKSVHRDDGNEWRRTMLDGILGTKERIQRAMELLASGQAGIVAPPGGIYTLKEFWEANRDRVAHLLRQIDVDIDRESLDFVAGTMFWCRPEALAPLLELARTPGFSFEPELGQVDGTLAHAMERCISIAARARGDFVVELDR
jgi:lipopolysaccharide biosynthesis protein